MLGRPDANKLVLLMSIGLTLLPQLPGNAAETQTVSLSKETEPQSFIAGNGLLQRELYDPALAEYRKFLMAAPDHSKAPVGRYAMAVCLFRLGRWEEAQTELSRVLPLGPAFEFSAESLFLSGQCAMALADPTKASAPLERLIMEHPHHTLVDAATDLLIEAFLRQGRLDRARDHGRRLRTKQAGAPLPPRVAYHLGFAEYSLGEIEAAIATLAPLLTGADSSTPLGDGARLISAHSHYAKSNHAEAERMYREVLGGFSPEARRDALLGLGRTLRMLGKPAEAAAHLEEFLQSASIGDKSEIDDARWELGRVRFDLEQFDAARKAWKAITSHSREHYDDAVFWTAKALIRQNEHSAAVALLRQEEALLAASEWAAPALYELALSLLRMGEASDAAVAIDRLRSTHPQSPWSQDALHVLAVAQFDSKEYEKSLASCDGHHQTSPAVKSTAVGLLAAENLFQLQRYSEAAERFRALLPSLSSLDDQRQATLRLGLCLYRMERWDEAMETLTPLAAVDVSPAAISAGAALTLGELHFQRGEWKTSAEFLALFLKRSSGSDGADAALLKLGLCALREGNAKLAATRFGELLGQHPQSPHRLQAMFELGQALMVLGEPLEARRLFEQVVKAPDARFASFANTHLGSLALSSGDAAAASDWYSSALASADAKAAVDIGFDLASALLAAKKYSEAEAALSSLLSRNAGHPRCVVGEAQRMTCLSRLERHSDALSLMKNISPDQVEKESPGMGNIILYERAWCLRKLDRNDEALAAYADLLKRPCDAGLAAQAAVESADLDMAAKRWSAAVATLKRAYSMEFPNGTAKDEWAAPARHRLAICQFQLGDHASALESFEAYLAHEPSGKIARSARIACAESCTKLGRLEQALKHLQAAALEPGDSQESAHLLLRQGETNVSLQRWDAGETAFAKFLESHAADARWPDARFGLGWCLENKGNIVEACDQYRRVTQDDNGPIAARAQFQIGECLFAEKKYSEAVAEFLKVDILFAHPEWSAAAMFEAARCFDMLAKPKEAHSHYTAVAQKYRGTKWAELASKQLAGATGATP